jgi:hypothetical protein
MSLADYAACDVDAMNGLQIRDFAQSVGEAAILELDKRGGPERYGELVSRLASESRLGVSEVAYGISVASSSLGLLKISMSSNGRTVAKG